MKLNINQVLFIAALAAGSAAYCAQQQSQFEKEKAAKTIMERENEWEKLRQRNAQIAPKKPGFFDVYFSKQTQEKPKIFTDAQVTTFKSSGKSYSNPVFFNPDEVDLTNFEQPTPEEIAEVQKLFRIKDNSAALEKMFGKKS